MNWMTAEEYLKKHEPGALAWMLDPENTLKQDTEKAIQLAHSVGLIPADERPSRLPEIVWFSIYPC